MFSINRMYDLTIDISACATIKATPYLAMGVGMPRRAGLSRSSSTAILIFTYRGVEHVPVRSPRMKSNWHCGDAAVRRGQVMVNTLASSGNLNARQMLRSMLLGLDISSTVSQAPP